MTKLIRYVIITCMLLIVLFATSDVKAKNYKFYLGQVELNTSYQNKLKEALRSATSDDEIRIIINSPGGSIAQMSSILNAMDESKAKIVTVNDGMAASAAAIIFFAGDELVTKKHCYFVFHLARVQNFLFGNIEILPLTHPAQYDLITTMDEYVNPYLNIIEKYSVLEKHDVRISCKEMRNRLSKPELLYEYRKISIKQLADELIEEKNQER